MLKDAIPTIGEAYMKRLITLATTLAVSCILHAQVVDSTVCDVLKAPASFNGKIVRIKGTATAGFDQFILEDQNCGMRVNAIWLSYPEGTHGKAGPVALMQMQAAKNFAGTVQAVQRTPVKMDKSKDFKQFDSLLATPHKIAGMCLGCNRYEVSATLVGRLDGVAQAAIKKDKAGKIVEIDGFGNMNAYPARLVIQSVAEVTPHDVDFSKSDEFARNDKPDATKTVGLDPDAATTLSNYHSVAPTSPTLDTIQNIGDNAEKEASSFPAGSSAQVAIRRAAEAYGSKSARNGVVTGFGETNEVNPKNEAQGARESPDGVLFNCTFNTSRLDSESMARAAIHIGEHIADIRTPQPEGELGTLYEMEYQAWATTVLGAVGARQRTLTLPGGYLLWNSAWPQSDQDKELQSAINGFLTKEEVLSR
jgi:hypothetical protein